MPQRPKRIGPAGAQDAFRRSTARSPLMITETSDTLALGNPRDADDTGIRPLRRLTRTPPGPPAPSAPPKTPDQGHTRQYA
ncbi:hypothetical protein GCM10023100_33700 [Actinocorallia cavernae]|uniref:Uncharacterized protein n=2 Tax=Actinomycetes TaxID=1760 RepID=A0ABP8SPR1_9ACTN